jgi:hypothetical protein
MNGKGGDNQVGLRGGKQGIIIDLMTEMGPTAGFDNEAIPSMTQPGQELRKPGRRCPTRVETNHRRFACVADT